MIFVKLDTIWISVCGDGNRYDLEDINTEAFNKFCLGTDCLKCSCCPSFMVIPIPPRRIKSGTFLFLNKETDENGNPTKEEIDYQKFLDKQEVVLCDEDQSLLNSISDSEFEELFKDDA